MGVPSRNLRQGWRIVSTLLAGGLALCLLRIIFVEVSPTNQTIRELRGGDSGERLAAALQLTTDRGLDADRVVVALVGALGDDEANVRFQAAFGLNEVLYRMGRSEEEEPHAVAVPGPSSVEPAIEALVAASGDPSRDVRVQSIRALEWTPPGSPQAETVIARLSRTIRDPDPSIRLASVRPLALLAARRSSASRALIDALDDPSESVRVEVVSQVGRLRGADGGVLFPIILAGLRDESASVRDAATESAQRLPNVPTSATPELFAMLQESASPPGEIVATLDGAWIGSWETIVALGPVVEKIAREEARLRRIRRHHFTDAVGALLQRTGPDARAIVPGLDETLSDAIARRDDLLLLATSRALAGIAPSSPSGRRAISALIARLGETSGIVPLGELADDAMGVLGMFGREAEPALPLLRELADGGDRNAAGELDRIERTLGSAGDR